MLLRHTTCYLKKRRRRINFLNLFNFFLPCHFPGSSFQYTANSKLFPRRWLRSSKVFTLPSDYTDGPHSVQAELPQEPTCTQKYLEVRYCGHTATCLGVFAAKAANFLPNSCKVLGRAKRAKELFPCNYNHIVCSDTSLKLIIKYFLRGGSHRHDGHQWRFKLEKICVS